MSPEATNVRAAPTLREGVVCVSRGLRDQIEANPLQAVFAAACVGFALGGGIPRGVLTLLLGVGARAVGSRLGDVILEQAPSFRAAQGETA